MVTIREYRDGDEAGILALVRELQAHETALYERMKPLDEIGIWYLSEVENLCAESAGRILVAEADGGSIVGYASILSACNSEDDFDETPFLYGYLADLSVSEHRRGEGIGTLLLQACEAFVREAGRDELRVSVLAKNGDAHRLYRRSGFADHLVTLRKKLG